MAGPKSNKLLPIILGMVVIAAALVLFGGSGGGDDGGLTSVPHGPGPDADSPAETLRTVSAQLTAMRKQLREQREENAQLLRQKQDITKDIEYRINARLAAIADNAGQTGGTPDAATNDLMMQVQDLRGEVASLRAAPAYPFTPPTLDPVEPAWNPVQTAAVIWTQPIGRKAPAAGPGALERGLLDASLPGPGSAGAAGSRQSAGTAPDSSSSSTVPVYTIADNSTLIGSTAMTALVGRIPIKGQVSDPYPFKVLIGRDNLAANGLEIPGVVGMVFSGTAVGDWNLSCVSGSVDSATFVFEDGTIRSVEAENDTGVGQGGALSVNKGALGWISDNTGVPCVSGKKVTNAPSYLAGRTLVATIAAVAEAAAAAQTTNVVSPIGGTSTSVVTGDDAKFILGKGFGDGMAEVTKWMDERQSQSFDAIFVPPGVTVAVHIEQEIRIDYDPTGRKLAYEHNLFQHGANGGLD